MTILQRLNERKKELRDEMKEMKDWDFTLEEKKTQRLFNEHRIDEIDYIIVLLKEEGIIKQNPKKLIDEVLGDGDIRSGFGYD